MEQYNPENKETREVITSRIDLQFFRHAEKESIKGRPDEELRLTDLGKRQAVEKSESIDISQSVAFGSSTKRTQHTAGFVMGGKLDGIIGDENFEELSKKLNFGIGFGSKVGTDERLNFSGSFSTEFGKNALESHKKGEYLKFLIERSDHLAELLHDLDAETYSRMAERVAQIVNKYLTIAPRFDELVKDKGNGYGDTLKRFLCTHLGIAESFLAKIIEKTKGNGERDRFVSVLNNQGFDFTEGFDVNIETMNGDSQQIHISFNKIKDGETIFEYNEVVPKRIIDILIHPGLEKE